jgi:putative tryptophan/tyrosine transport system substrate-binding protein
MISRRSIIAAVSAVVLPPRAAFPQSSAPPVIGLLGSAAASEWTRRLDAFHEGLAETGFVESRNLAVEYRWAENRNERLASLANELVRRKVRVIVVLGNSASALAAKQATRAIPIVFRIGANPIDIGLVSSLARPGGNSTGITTLGIDLAVKQVDLLREVAPSAGVVGLLVNPTIPMNAQIQTRSVAAVVGGKLEVVEASRDEHLEAAFLALRAKHVGGLIVGTNIYLNVRSNVLAALASRFAVPTISPYREFVEAGGLLSYGGSIAGALKQAGIVVGRILNKERPEYLPVQQVTSVEMLVNLKTAQMLGLPVPASLLARADEVIE